MICLEEVKRLIKKYQERKVLVEKQLPTKPNAIVAVVCYQAIIIDLKKIEAWHDRKLQEIKDYQEGKR